jgi:large subunit ribosomal protein L34e
MAQRVTLRKRQPYNTSSSRRRIVKTPGGVLRYHHIKKLATAPKCGDCGSKLSGVRSTHLFTFSCTLTDLAVQVVALRPRQYATVSKTKKNVTRAYGGSRCGGCVRSRYVIPLHSVFLRVPLIINIFSKSIVRAFLIEEAKVVKRVIKSQQNVAVGRS